MYQTPLIRLHKLIVTPVSTREPHLVTLSPTYIYFTEAICGHIIIHIYIPKYHIQYLTKIKQHPHHSKQADPSIYTTTKWPSICDLPQQAKIINQWTWKHVHHQKLNRKWVENPGRKILLQILCHWRVYKYYHYCIQLVRLRHVYLLTVFI